MPNTVFNNALDQEDLFHTLSEVFGELDKILSDHSGPFATNAIIGSKWRQQNDIDEFSKDGVKILLHLIVSEDPCARMAVRMARFVGLRVDARCHDGTTTAMQTFCRLARVALQEMVSDYRSANRYNWANNLESTIKACQTFINHVKITEEDLVAKCQEKGIATTPEEIRASIAYHMAMISSKGDHDLATMIAEVIKSSPKKIYGMFKDSPLAIETEEKYLLEKQDYDLAINANLGNIQDYNYRSDTQYLCENAVIFATANEIATASWESMFLTSFISTKANQRVNLTEFGDTKGWEHYHQGKKNLVILTPTLSDSEVIMAINDFNNKNPTLRISWFNTQCHPRMRTSLDKTLHYMAGSLLFRDTMMNPIASLIGLEDYVPSVKVHLIGHTLTLTGLYEKNEEVYHPFFADPTAFQPYTDFVKETEDLIEFASKNITHHALDHDEFTYLITLYRALTTQSIYDIKIGGSSHDQYANRTVYEDAIGAALSAVSEGVVLGGYGHLYNALSSSPQNNDNMYGLFADVFASIVEDSLRHSPDDPFVRKLISHSLSDKWSYVVAVANHYVVGTIPAHYIKEGSLEDSLDLFLKREKDSAFLLQAYAGFHEQFKRCIDILPRLAHSTHLVDMRVKPGEVETVR